jgi:predicted dehydrogenase
MIMDAPVEEVTSYATRSANEIFAPYEYDTTSTTILRFKDGRVGKVASVIDCLQPYYFHTHLVGSEGSLLDDRIHSARLGTDKSRWSSLATPLVDSGDVKDHPYQPQFQAFVDALRAGRKMPLTDFDTALESHRVIFAADLSAKKGAPVRLGKIR